MRVFDEIVDTISDLIYTEIMLLHSARLIAINAQIKQQKLWPFRI
jgi:hypothetical protein